MKKPITLNAFHEQVKKLAQKKNRPYFTAEVKTGEHIYNDGTSRMFITFQCYVDGYGFHNGKTIAEALSKLRHTVFPERQVIPVVEILEVSA